MSVKRPTLARPELTTTLRTRAATKHPGQFSDFCEKAFPSSAGKRGGVGGKNVFYSLKVVFYHTLQGTQAADNGN